MLKMRLEMISYHLNFEQLLKPTDHVTCTNFYVKRQKTIVENGILDHVVFSDKSTFCLSGSAQA